MLIFTRRWGPVAIKYPTVPIGILARCSRASRKSAPRTLWIALVRAPRQFVPRQDEKLLRLVPLLSTVRVQRSLPFFSIFFTPFFFLPFRSFAREGWWGGIEPLSVEKLAEFRGRRVDFFRPPFSLWFSNSANFSPEDAPIHGYTLLVSERRGSRMCLWYRVFREFTTGESGGGVSRKGREDELDKGWRSFFRRVSCTKTELQVVFVSFSFFSCRRFWTCVLDTIIS